MSTTMKNVIVAGIVALVVAIGVLLGARALSPVDNSGVSPVAVMAPDGSVIGTTAPIRASSGPPVPACSTPNTYLECQGTGVPFAWNPVTIDGSVAGNVYLTSLTTTGTYTAGNVAPVMLFTIPVAPASKDASSYVGVADYDFTVTGRIVDAGGCWVSQNFNYIVANTGGSVSAGGGGSTSPEDNPLAPTISWGVDSGLDAASASNLLGSLSDAGNLIIGINANNWLCPGVVADAATYATTVNYTVNYSN